MKKYDGNTIIQRVKILRTQHAGARGRSKFARALGISPSTYSYYETTRVPPIEILLKISELTGADLKWLLTGRQPDKKTSTSLEKFALSSDKLATNSPNKQLFQKLDALLAQNPNLAEPIIAFIELFCEKMDFEQKITIQPPLTSPKRPSWIPILGRTAAGIIHFWDQTYLPEPKQAVTELNALVLKHLGKTIIGSVDVALSVDLQARALLDSIKGKTARANLIQVGGEQQEQIFEFVQCEEIFKMFPDSFALQIDGDSMSPRINDGDIVIVSSSVPAAQGHIAIARIANQIGVTCKLIRTTEKEVHLIPINEKYETKVVSKKDLLWALAVLCHISI